MTAQSAESLIIPLQHATETGAITWKRDPNGQYQIAFGDNAVKISTTLHGYTLQILNKDQETVDWIGAYTLTDKSYKSLHGLYDIVDRQTRNVDAVVSDILRQIDAVASLSR